MAGGVASHSLQRHGEWREREFPYPGASGLQTAASPQVPRDILAFIHPNR